MGCDIHLFAEGYTADVRDNALWNREPGNRRWKNIEHWYRDDVWADLRIQGDGGFSRRDLIDGHRDYGLFYLLAGVRGEEEESSWPPIAKPRGLPEQMDDLVFRYETDEMEIGSIDCHDLSWLTLRELKESGYGGRMPLKAGSGKRTTRKCWSLMRPGNLTSWRSSMKRARRHRRPGWSAGNGWGT